MPLMTSEEAAIYRLYMENAQKPDMNFSDEDIEKLKELEEKFVSDPANRDMVISTKFNPETGEVVYDRPEGESDEIALFDRMLLKNTNATPEETVNYLRKHYPNLEVLNDQGGVAVRKRDSKDAFKYMDDPTQTNLKDIGDVLDVGGEVALGLGANALLPGSGTGVLANMAMGAVQGAAGSGVAQTLREALKGAAGINEGKSMTDVGSDILTQGLWGGAGGAIAGQGVKYLGSDGKFAIDGLRDKVIKQIAAVGKKSTSELSKLTDQQLWNMVNHKPMYNTPLPALGKNIATQAQRYFANKLSTDSLQRLIDLKGKMPEGSYIGPTEKANAGIRKVLNVARNIADKNYTKAELGVKGQFDTKDLFNELSSMADQIRGRAALTRDNKYAKFYNNLASELDDTISQLKGPSEIPGSAKADLKGKLAVLQDLDTEIKGMEFDMARLKDPVKIADYEQRISILKDKMLSGVADLKMGAAKKPTFSLNAPELFSTMKDINKLTKPGIEIPGINSGKASPDLSVLSSLRGILNKSADKIKAKNPELKMASREIGSHMNRAKLMKKYIQPKGQVVKPIDKGGETSPLLNALAESLDYIKSKRPNASVNKQFNMVKDAISDAELAALNADKTATVKAGNKGADSGVWKDIEDLTSGALRLVGASSPGPRAAAHLEKVKQPPSVIKQLINAATAGARTWDPITDKTSSSQEEAYKSKWKKFVEEGGDL